MRWIDGPQVVPLRQCFVQFAGVFGDLGSLDNRIDLDLDIPDSLQFLGIVGLQRILGSCVFQNADLA